MSEQSIDTLEVLEAAGRKWNFLPFRPKTFALSLSKGGHCIGVDPYYLTHKAQEIGYHPEVILAGRQFASKLGPTFKEGCPDLRNTKVIDVVEAEHECRADFSLPINPGRLKPAPQNHRRRPASADFLRRRPLHYCVPL